MHVGSKLLTLLSSSFHLRHLAVLRLSRYARHPVAAFSSAAVSHGRLHFAFAHPNCVSRSRVVKQFHAEAAAKEESGEALNSVPGTNNSHPWAEWSKLSGLLVEKGYSDRCTSSGEDDDSFAVDDDLPEEFLRSAKACLGFARDRPDILRLLTKKNIEAVVLNGSPFLFKNGENSSRRMKLFFNGEGSSELELEKAETVDFMQYLLSYIYGSLSSSDDNGIKSDELVEKSVRKLLSELYNLSGTIWKSKSVDASLRELPSSNGQFSMSSGKDNESNYTKFVPPSFVASESQSNGPDSFTDAEYRISPVNQKQVPEEPSIGRTHNSYINNSSSLKNTPSSLNTLRSNFGANSTESSSGFSTLNSNPAESSTDLGQPPSYFGNNYNSTDNCEYTGNPNQPSGNLWRSSNTSNDGSAANLFTPQEKSWSTQHTYDGSYNVNSTPPFNNSSSTNGSTMYYSGSTTTSSPSRPASSSSQPLSNSWDNHLNSTPPSSSISWSNNNATNSSRPTLDPWSGYNASYAGNTTNSTSPLSNYWDNKSRSTDYRSNYNMRNEGFGETSYHGFTENSTPPLNNSSSSKSASYGTASTENSPQPLPNSWNNNTSFSSQPPVNSTNNYDIGPKIYAEPIRNPWNANNTYRGYAENSAHPSSNPWNSNSSTYSGGPSSNPAQPSDGNSWNTSESWRSGFPRVNTEKNATYGYSGKSLEGSCVKEPDPLDMSEEAKAERWFRRAAQIKDISELSQIPDEDFPQIMPMRKGVNRFVVSKRKTPLERRLASQQYRRNLPVVSTEPAKEPTVGEKTANDGSDSHL